MQNLVDPVTDSTEVAGISPLRAGQYDHRPGFGESRPHQEIEESPAIDCNRVKEL